MQAKIATVAFATHQITKPDGITPNGYLAWLTRSNVTVAAQQLPDTARHCTLTIEEPGVYVARVVRMDTDGNSIGPAAESDAVVVTEDMVEVPLTVTLSISDAVATPRNAGMPAG